MGYLRDLFRSVLGGDVVLFTTDGSGESYLQCGAIDGVYATVDFGPGSEYIETWLQGTPQYTESVHLKTVF